MKKVGFLIITLLSLGLGLFQWTFAAGPTLDPTNPFLDTKDAGSAEDVAVIGAKDGEAKEDALVNVIKWGINWVLGILALIALIVLMYGGFLMVTSAGEEERYKKWRTILKHAAIGLMLIGVARFIVSIIFWLVNKTTLDAPAAGTES